MIALENICVTFNKNTPDQVKAMQHVTVTINAGEFVTIIGHNGSGKSTFLNVIAGSLQPDSGNILIENTNVNRQAEHERSRLIARLFQNPTTGTISDLSIVENFRIAYLRNNPRTLFNRINSDFRKQVQESVAKIEMGLEAKLDSLVGNLSGGQRQALSLLMAAQSNCSILMLDEPTAALDPKSATLVMHLSKQLATEKKLCVLYITHSMRDAIQYGNRLLQFKDGMINRDFMTDEKRILKPQDLMAWFDE
ncbi:MAG: ATP-binding cassette domain-containing protein [Bacteroidetes bacterium]|nr:ATP-binding cassette domain-containing protein [Bacteroidota bacterium]